MGATDNIVIAANGTELIRYDWDALATTVLDMMCEKPEGVTLVQLVERLEVPEHIARRAVNKTREYLADDGDTNIIAVPYGRERRYQLVTESGAQTDSWVSFNKRYVHSRLRTVQQVYACLVRGAKSDRERDQAARILRTIERLIEDVEDMETSAGKE